MRNVEKSIHRGIVSRPVAVLVARWIAIVCVLCATTSVDAQVRARFRRVGLFEGTMPIVRTGCTSLVSIDLSWSGAEPFDGELRVAQQDRDGDIVISAQDLGGLTPDGEWHPKEVYFYPSIFSQDSTLQVRLYDANGDLVKMQLENGDEVGVIVTPQFTSEPSADELLIVDLTNPRKLPHLLCLDVGNNTAGLTNARHVRPMSPRELPQYWQGLEAVDAIVWDDADPTELSERQITALVEWVKNGGSLLITAGKNWQSLAKSSLARHLPVTIKGVTRVREAQEFTRDIVKNETYSNRLMRRYAKNPIARCDMIKLPDMIGIPSDARGLSPIAYRNLLGRGNLTFVGASLRDLLPAPAGIAKAIGPASAGQTESNDGFKEFHNVCERVLASNFLGLPKSIEPVNAFMQNRKNLYDEITGTISYKGLGFAFMMFALFFAAAYFFSASGSFYYMKKRQWQQHSWSAFAIVSLVGTVIGVVMVWSLRGMSTKVRQTTILDVRAGSDYAYGTCFFGVKTPDHTRLGLRLPAGYTDANGPQDLGPLRTLPRSTTDEASESTFVATDTYRAEQACLALKDVPVRATLKEFWGRWHGPLGGTLDAKLVVNADDNNRFGKGSYIQNNTGVTLENCIIVEGRQEIAGESGLVLARCLELGTLPKSGKEASLDADTIAERLYFRKDPLNPNDPPKAISNDQLSLASCIKTWRESINATFSTDTKSTSISGKELTALRLLSLFDLIERDSNGRNEMTRSHGRILDCSHAVTRETALLIGFAYEPAPAMLEVNGVRRTPENSITMYRITIPVERPGRSAGGSADEETEKKKT
ncbi:MAG: hypothetical protein IPK83_05810 [Planctomycetes bacterium]|nr:hypothetical protein [Planctomycetota bacterium]